jgi:hypothetical protein
MIRPQYFTGLLMAALFASPAMAPTHAESANAPAGDAAPALTGARIQFATNTFDFGRALTGTSVRHDFVFTNTGSATLEITRVQTACGCTTAGEWDRKVAPGGRGVIPLQLKTAGLSGEITKHVTVVCNDPEHPSVLLEVKGDVWRAFDTRPTMAVFLASEETRTNITRVVRIIGNLEEPVTLSDLQCTNSAFRLELKTIRPGKEFELLITAAPPFAPHSVFAPIILKTSSATAPEIRIPTQFVVQPGVVALPDRLTLPDGPLATALSPAVNIRNNGTNALVLSDASVNVPNAEVRVQEIQTNRLFRLTVNFPAGFEIKPDEKIEVSLKSNHPKFPVIRVPVSSSNRPVLSGASSGTSSLVKTQ